MAGKLLQRDFGRAFWERVQFFICLAFPVVSLVLCCDAALQVAQNVLLCFHFVFLLLFSLCALSHSASASFSFFSANSSVHSILRSWLNCSGSLHFWNHLSTIEESLISSSQNTFPSNKALVNFKPSEAEFVLTTKTAVTVFIFYYLPDFSSII